MVSICADDESLLQTLPLWRISKKIWPKLKHGKNVARTSIFFAQKKLELFDEGSYDHSEVPL